MWFAPVYFLTSYQIKPRKTLFNHEAFGEPWNKTTCRKRFCGCVILGILKLFHSKRAPQLKLIVCFFFFLTEVQTYFRVVCVPESLPAAWVSGPPGYSPTDEGAAGCGPGYRWTLFRLRIHPRVKNKTASYCENQLIFTSREGFHKQRLARI